MRMLAPRVGVCWSRDDVERAGTVAETLASGRRHNHGALALRFERDEFHGYGLARGACEARGFGPKIGMSPQVGQVYFAARRGENYGRALCRDAELTNGRVRRGVRRHRLRPRRHRLRRCAPVLR